ncbi:hypothetical protein M9Y10_009244 [Tritrichomonas musculus]|uniref:Ubiquitin-like domain-containing protein n=1 Tax=Tritrichomonas musculus TaxID=1915356 RepID=A0ABR2IMS7_9EUKA
MYQDTCLVYITLHISAENTKRIAIDNVPAEITSEQFLEKIAPIIFENTPKNNHRDQNFLNHSNFNYCLKVGDKILEDTDIIEASEVDVIERPEEITNIANICLFLSLLLMFVAPAVHFYYFRNYFITFHLFILGAFIYGFFVKIFPEKKNYNSLGLKFKPKKNSIFEALIILIKSFNPKFRLEDVLLDQ